MLRLTLSLLALLPYLTFAVPEARVAFAMRSGVLLRMHVVAQDDTDEMQRVKLLVRDAVRDAYAENHRPGLTMRRAAEAMLPELTLAAERAARDAGFDGTVDVRIETLSFDARELEGHVIPAGEYPALMIRLGEAKGRNWWGLIDPALALWAAAAPDASPGGAVQWDWSLRALIEALLGIPLPAEAPHA